MNLLDVNHLYNTILSCVDMKIKNTVVYSQSQPTNGEIYFNERMLKYNPNGFTLVHNGEVMFDPLNNFKQAQYLFSIFLQLEEEDGELYTQMFYDEKSGDKTRIFMRTNLGNFASQYYYNISLGYLELILALSGIQVDNLMMFDSAPPVEEEQKRRRRPLFPLRDLF